MSVSRTSLRSAALRAATALLAVGATAIGATALSAPAHADDKVEVTKVTVTSQKAVAWSSVHLNAEWKAEDPAAGQTLTVSLGKGLHWPMGRSFHLAAKNDPNTSVGDCAVQADRTTLVCTFNDKIDRWDDVEGNLWADAQITNDLIGAKSSSLKVGERDVIAIPGDKDGDGTCDTQCDGVIPEPPSKDTFKRGWLSAINPDGTYTYAWSVNVYGAKTYEVTDKLGTFKGLDCTTSDWSKAFRPKGVKYDETTKVVSWSVDSTDTVCRVRYHTVSDQQTTTNTAVVNGKEVSGSAEARANGGGEVDGRNRPTPAPTPSATPSQPSATPTPSATPSQPAVPVPTTSPNPDDDDPSPSLPPNRPSSTPSSPAVVPPVGTPSNPPLASKPPATTTPPRPGLPRTGTATEIAVIAAAVSVAAGAGLLAARRRQSD